MTQEIIKEIRRLSGLSVKDFAAKINVGHRTVSRWEKGLSEPVFINQKTIRYHFPLETKMAESKI